MPNTPGTTRRTIRIPDEEYEPAKAKAAERGETITDVVRRALREYVQEEAERDRSRG